MPELTVGNKIFADRLVEVVPKCLDIVANVTIDVSMSRYML